MSVLVETNIDYFDKSVEHHYWFERNDLMKQSWQKVMRQKECKMDTDKNNEKNKDDKQNISRKWGNTLCKYH